jgi:hypothetical protein
MTATTAPIVGRRDQPTAIRQSAGSASRLIDARIAELGDWRGQTLGRMRKLIHKANPDVVETWKWQ